MLDSLFMKCKSHGIKNDQPSLVVLIPEGASTGLRIATVVTSAESAIQAVQDWFQSPEGVSHRSDST
jgi:hypothetical protein